MIMKDTAGSFDPSGAPAAAAVLATQTTCRVGSDSVSVVLAHRQDPDLPVPPPAVWVTAPVPVGVEEVAALLYVVLDSEEVRTGDPGDARWLVADLVVNGGCGLVEESRWTVLDARDGGSLDTAHWAACLRLAYLATTGVGRAVAGSACGAAATT